jgi:hypothetical protein
MVVKYGRERKKDYVWGERKSEEETKSNLLLPVH